MIVKEEVESAGPGGIPTELLKHGGKNVITLLRDMFHEILAGDDILQEWNSTYIGCIYKQGNKKYCNNYRGRSIINSIGRFSEVVKDKIENMIKTKASEEEQQGNLV
jgi:hypothetical protein